MNTKHFFIGTFLVLGFIFSTLTADAQRRHGGYGRARYHHARVYRPIHHRPPVLCAPPVRHHRYARRHNYRASIAYCGPHRRVHHHRWHR